ncbi:MAG: HAD family hydrolase [Pyrinomonadaceae bacterium]
MITNVIFDVDGTLVDSNDFHAQAWQKAFEKFGKQVELKDVRAQIGKGGDQLMPVFLSEEEINEFGEELEKARGEIFKSEFLPRVQTFPEARTLMAKMVADGKKIALASSAHPDELNHFKELLGIEDFLDAETSAKDVEESKPEPDVFIAALKELGNPSPEQTIVIGDSPYDAIAADKIGLQTIGLLCGGFDEDLLKREGCAEIYQNPADLLQHYDDSLLCSKEVVKPKTLSDVVGALLV